MGVLKNLKTTLKFNRGLVWLQISVFLIYLGKNLNMFCDDDVLYIRSTESVLLLNNLKVGLLTFKLFI